MMRFLAQFFGTPFRQTDLTVGKNRIQIIGGYTWRGKEYVYFMREMTYHKWMQYRDSLKPGRLW